MIQEHIKTNNYEKGGSYSSNRVATGKVFETLDKLNKERIVNEGIDWADAEAMVDVLGKIKKGSVDVQG